MGSVSAPAYTESDVSDNEGKCVKVCFYGTTVVFYVVFTYLPDSVLGFTWYLLLSLYIWWILSQNETSLFSFVDVTVQHPQCPLEEVSLWKVVRFMCDVFFVLFRVWSWCRLIFSCYLCKMWIVFDSLCIYCQILWYAYESITFVELFSLVVKKREKCAHALRICQNIIEIHWSPCLINTHDRYKMCYRYYRSEICIM